MSKEAWKTAKAELEAIEKEREALIAVAVEPIRERYESAKEKLELIEEDSPERIGQCEGCGDPIWEGERYAYDRMSSIYMCQPCAPTYGDMLADPTNFYDAEDEYYTAERAKEVVDSHIAAGGSLDDMVG
jgi:hypothetical protein